MSRYHWEKLHVNHFWELKGLIPIKENIIIWALYTSPLSLPFPIQEREFGRLSVSALLSWGQEAVDCERAQVHKHTHKKVSQDWT